MSIIHSPEFVLWVAIDDLKKACHNSCWLKWKWRESMCWRAQTNDMHRSHCSLCSVLWTVTLDSCERVMRMAAWELKPIIDFNLSITVRRWVTISTCQGTVLEITSDSALLPFHCILKCKWLTFSQSHCDIESFFAASGVRAAAADVNRHRSTTHWREHFRDDCVLWGLFSSLHYRLSHICAVHTAAHFSVFMFANQDDPWSLLCT